MRKLIEGIHKFRESSFREDQELFKSLAKGQNPLALFITCSDSRVDPNYLTHTKPGDLFIQRTAGNIVPPYGHVLGGEAATIEYAVSALKVQDIIICGHSHCGAMGGLLHPDKLETMPAVKSYLQHAEATRRIVDENYKDVYNEDERLSVAVEENVLVQLENLRTHPSVAAAVGRGDLKLHGWVYKFETGEVFTFDPALNQFTPVEEGEEPMTELTRSMPPV